MLSRYGLRGRMAASYVLVSAAAVVVVEIVLLTVVAPAIRSASETVDKATGQAVAAARDAAQAKARLAAAEDAGELSRAATEIAARRPGITDAALLAAVAEGPFASSRLNTAIRDGSATGVVEVLAGRDRRVVATSSAKAAAVGSLLPVTGDAAGWAGSAVGVTGTGGTRSRPIGFIHVAVDDRAGGDPTVMVRDTEPAAARTDDAAAAATRGIDVDRALLLPGVVLLALLVPVGVLFGMLSTGRLIRRVERLAGGTARMAGGDLASRVPVSGDDEIGKLEQGFNAMAQRLEAAVQEQRDAAAARARVAERTRIARELHDSVSQQLFSLNLLAGGLRRALPPGSELHRQTESMERTVDRTMREMRAMLLELRPVGLEDAGLVAALDELCEAYEVRLGVRISADVEDVRMDPPVEHAVLRVVQEALANAARHGQAELIELSLAQVQGHVVIAIRDEGLGFDPARAAERHGLGLELMRERVGELGGTMQVTSAPARGTTVRVSIPAGVS